MTLEHAAMDALTRLKVKDLQRELKKRGLDASGLKAVLLQRLRDHMQQNEVLETPEKEEKEGRKDELVEVEGEEQEKMEEVRSEEEEMVEDVKEEEEEEKQEEKEEEEGSEGENQKEEEIQRETDEKEKATILDCQKDGDVNIGDSETQRDEARGLEYDGVGGKNGETGALKRERGAVDELKDLSDTKKAKLDNETEASSRRPVGEDQDNTETVIDDADADKKVMDDGAIRDGRNKATIRVDNFVRPFTLNAVKALVQECGPFVEGGFWMDAIKTHCFVTYTSPKIAENTIAALNGKLWPPENGRSLKVRLVDHTAMEVAQFGEANIPSLPKREGSSEQAPARPEVTIDEFFLKTETKPVLYYLPLTDDQIQQKKERLRQPEGQPRKRRHRGGRKRNRRARFQRR
ncbi:unnamed protein product [Hyaloperonospora brassicae]|uniref:SAP domain-containing protein n=1 Tax=Hyaloperonospora brassicae TaxID=162125 RepID=A0AAV0UDT7_HYABA|nr:unnamed protein product [Hyaloperonospora brassicae]